MTRFIVPFGPFYYHNLRSTNTEPNYYTTHFPATRIERTDFIARVTVCLLFASLFRFR